MPLDGAGEVVGEVVVRVAMEAGGETVHRRYGWKGCLALSLVTAGVIAGLIYWFA